MLDLTHLHIIIIIQLTLNDIKAVADPEISKRGGTDRMLYTPLTAHARKKLYAQCDSAGKMRGHVPLVPYAESATEKCEENEYNTVL